MKKWLSILLAVTMVFTITACTAQPAASSAPAQEAEKPQIEFDEAGIPIRPESYPDKQLTLICPFAAGGAIDNSLRAMLPILEKYGVSAIVTNVTGSSGATGAFEAINAKPDGYTLSTIGPGFVGAWAQGQIDFSWDDVAFITRTTMDTNGWFVSVDSELQTAQDVVDFIIAHPGELTVGIAGNDQSQAIMLEDALSEELNGQPAITILGYEGASRAATEVIGGHIMVATGKMADYITHIQAGTMRPVMSLAAGKSPVFDESILTFNELPYNDILPVGDPAANTTFLVGNKDIPDEIVEYLYQVFKLVLESDEYQAYCANAGSIAQPITPEECRSLADDYYQIKYDVAKVSGLVD